ncbi:DUF1987 domain-containing protein [Chitinimonas sp. BJB300]|uniref:DUF1987 domain-containing protein n=1 Tax=Chitinimonas sp. BJB300 TaxID=1559339 RepID=UPI002697CA0D|nr:DUF1987 domain-containing protein [Chitinimonas sp. BJB300]
MMENLFIAATPSTPEVDFRFDQHMLAMKGESYPENATAFYGPILERVRQYLSSCSQTPIQINVSLAYFNSSSTKLLFSMFDAFNQAAAAGNKITLNWFHDADDETLFEFGQEIHEDFPVLNFVDIPVNTD